MKSRIWSSAFLIWFLPSLLVAAGQLPVETDLLWKKDCVWIGSANLGVGDTDCLLAILNDNWVQPFDQQLKGNLRTFLVDQGDFRLGRSIAGGSDTSHLWATSVRHDSLFLLDLPGGRRMFVTVGTDHARPKGWDGSATQVILADINGDGRLEAVVLVNSAWDYQPRGVYVLDWDDGRSLWSYKVGPALQPTNRMLLRDIDSDGKQEIFFGSAAFGNGNGIPVNGVSDSVSCVFSLNCGGKLRWMDTIGRYSSEVRVFWLDSDRESPKIVAGEIGNHVLNRGRDSLFLVDPLAGTILKRASTGCLNWDLDVVRDAHHRTRTITSGADETLRVLDESLRIVKARGVPGMNTECLCAADFTGGGSEEVAVITSVGGLLLFDSGLNLLSDCSKTWAGQAEPVSIRCGRRHRLLVREAKDADAWFWSLFDFGPKPVLARSIPLRFVVVGGIVLLLLFTGVLGYSRYRQTRDIRSVIRSLTGRAGVIELNRKGEIANVNQRAKALIRQLDCTQQSEDRDLGDHPHPSPLSIKGEGGQIKQGRGLLGGSGPLAAAMEAAKAMAAGPDGVPSRENVVSLGPGQSYQVRCVRAKTGAVVTIEDISDLEFLQRVRSWIPVAQKLAHGIKTPLSAVTLSLQHLEKHSDSDGRRFIDGVREDVERLRKMTDGFMRFTRLEPPKLETCDLNTVLRECAVKFERAKPVGVTISYELVDKLPPVALDKEQFSSAIANLVENAIAAMSGAKHKDTKGTKEISERGFEDTGSHHQDTKSTKGVSEDKPEDSGVQHQGTKDANGVPDYGQETSGVLRVVTTLTKETGPGAKSESRLVEITVSDTGPGIPERYLAKVFEPYFTTKVGGTGLGMCITKKIIEEHKGSIAVESREGEGTRVIIRLPAAW